MSTEGAGTPVDGPEMEPLSEAWKMAQLAGVPAVRTLRAAVRDDRRVLGGSVTELRSEVQQMRERLVRLEKTRADLGWVHESVRDDLVSRLARLEQGYVVELEKRAAPDSGGAPNNRDAQWDVAATDTQIPAVAATEENPSPGGWATQKQPHTYVDSGRAWDLRCVTCGDGILNPRHQVTQAPAPSSVEPVGAIETQDLRKFAQTAPRQDTEPLHFYAEAAETDGVNHTKAPDTQRITEPARPSIEAYQRGDGSWTIRASGNLPWLLRVMAALDAGKES